MGILFDDEASAKEYIRWLKEEGTDAIIRKRHLGISRVANWEVVRTGKTRFSQGEKVLVESGIPREHIITYESAEDEPEGGFASFIRPRVKTAHGSVTQPHVLMAHELAHQRLRHTKDRYITANDTAEFNRVIEEEKSAWREAARTLKANGEWNTEAKEAAAGNLASYYTLMPQYEKNPRECLEKARQFIRSL